MAPAAKSGARGGLPNWLDGRGEMSVLVRVNAPRTVWFADDLRVCRHPAVSGVVLPKAEQAPTRWRKWSPRRRARTCCL